ncbi:MAG: LamG domain-containing protein [Verrucomicrobiales bacterium]|nr:LamG domain-containing protein [Verrucomicrobiales bacterium]
MNRATSSLPLPAAVSDAGRRLPKRLVLLPILLTLGTTPVQAERVLTFGGSGAAVLPSANAYRFGASNDFAVELWLKPGNAGGDPAAVFTNDNFDALTGTGTNGGWGLYWQSGGLRVARKASISSATATPLGGNPGELVPVTAGQWHHVVVNFKKPEKLTFHVDGALKETSTDAFNSWAYFQRVFDSYKEFRLGADPSGGNRFQGAIDEVRIWNRVRTTAEIANAHAERVALSGAEPGLLAYYQFNEATGAARCLGAIGQAGNLPLGSDPVRTDDPALTLTAALPPATDFALAFNGANQTVETGIRGDRLAGNELTIEYWFKGPKLQSAVRLQAGDRWVVSGWGPQTGQAPQQLINITGTDPLSLPITTVVPGVQDGAWHHVALTWKRNTPQGFRSYLDGRGGAGVDTPDEPFPALDARVFLGSFDGTSEFLQGQLDEVRIWNRALTGAEIQDHFASPRQLLGRDPGLVACYSFNDAATDGTRNTVGGELALFRNLTAASRVVQDGVGFAEPSLITAPYPPGAGLWLGEISLRNVSELPGGSGAPGSLAPAGGQFDLNVILHADAGGAVRLLKDVTIMQKRSATADLTDLVLVTDDTLLANFEGVLKRSGRLVGVRLSSAFHQFEGGTLPLAGGIGYGYRITGTNTVPASLPTNPFRHRYHPQHQDPADLQGSPYTLTRVIEIRLDGGGAVGLSDGRDRLVGTYRETIRGLHKQPLVTDGEIRLERISLVSKLNDR